MEDEKVPLVWLDMEMTGLEPDTCVPLQVAVVITDSDLKELDAADVTIWQPEQVLERMDPFVRRMHTDNGLLDRVRTSEDSLTQAEKKMLQVIAKWCPLGTGILSGNSIHTDRRFVKAYFPMLEGYLHYRMVDVSSIKELVHRWYGRGALFTKHQQKHTALEDVRESIAELRHYRELVMRAPSETQSSSTR